MTTYIYYGRELYHQGTKGMKWGERNYQNEDGSYTAKGQLDNNGHGRYYTDKPSSNSTRSLRSSKKAIDKRTTITKSSDKKKEDSKFYLTDKQKTYLKIGAAVAATALVAYGGYKLYQNKDTIADFIKEGKKYTAYSKKHGEIELDEGTILRTVAANEDRTRNADYFYATYTTSDKIKYRKLFGKNEDGSPKFTISNRLTSKTKIANEDDGIKAFNKLFDEDDNFRHFILDHNKMRKHFVDDKYKFPQYRKARDILEKIESNPKYQATAKDKSILYSMFNYVLPSEGSNFGEKGSFSQLWAGSEVTKQRQKFFDLLKDQGFRGVLDTNDSLYGGFKSNSAIILFDREGFVEDNVRKLTPDEVALISRRMDELIDKISKK